MVAEYLEQIRKDVGEHVPISKLADQLRDADIRGSEEVYNAIPEICTFLQKYMDMGQSYQCDFLRVMINLLADNDRNRDALIQNEFIWKTLLEKIDVEKDWHLVEVERLFIFLTQFIRNSNNVQEYANFFKSINIDKAIVRRVFNFVQHFSHANDASELFQVDAHVDDYLDLNGNMLELYWEMCKGQEYTSEGKDVLTFVKLLKVLQRVGTEVEEDDEYEEERENALLLISDIIIKLTSFDDMDANLALECQNSLLSVLENEYRIKSIRTKRQIFACIGNISSMPSFDNWLLSERCIKVIYASKATGTYLDAASCIVLGNCINSVDTREKLLSEITKLASSNSQDTFLDKVCHALATFNDVVQFQSIHLLVNFITEDLSKQLFYLQENFSALYKAAKVIIDNKTYYKEITDLLYKLVRKFIRTFPGSESRELLKRGEFWTLFEPLEDNDILLLLEQRVILEKNFPSGNGQETIIKLLLTNMVKPVESIKLEILLEKLKALAMAFQCDNISNVLEELFAPGELNEKILEPYLKFLESLYDSLSLPESANPAILLNNTKYVAATTKQYTGILGKDSKIVEICDNILKL